ncbi:hypothetical protein ACEWY4_011586 [Coilia grayii]|uniref:G-protein coupled receptors family 1 profile domain-containing protein n=1 Tax=Coilia grayii TaxID=363190 RepID=A0ABD1JYI1_9TELE
MTPEALLPNCSNCSQQGAPPGPGPEPALSVGKAVLLGLVLGVFLVLGVLGNVLVILWVALQRPLRSATHVFIGNLALADLLLSALVLPFSAALELRGRWALGRPLCDAWAALDVLCCTASILSLVAIAGDRYVGVSYPLRYPALVTPRRAGLALVGVWALAAAISEPAYAIFSAVGSFYAPLAVLLVMYARVYVVACRETRALREGRKTEPSERVTLRVHRGNTAASEDHAHTHTHTHRALRLLKFSREKRAAKTLGIVVGCFVLCWLPFFIVLPIGECV